jgi:ribosomal protein L39E
MVNEWPTRPSFTPGSTNPCTDPDQRLAKASTCWQRPLPTWIWCRTSATGSVAFIGKNQRLHWRDENVKRRRTIAATIAEDDIAHTVVIGTPLNEQKQERARRICMESMLMELDRRGVRQVWMESRKPSQDLKDLKMLDAARSKGFLGAGLRLDFARPKAEPMLWIPDAVAGALGAALKADDMIPREMLAASAAELRVGLG